MRESGWVAVATTFMLLSTCGGGSSPPGAPDPGVEVAMDPGQEVDVSSRDAGEATRPHDASDAPAEGEVPPPPSGCVTCHLDLDRVVADLEDDPLPPEGGPACDEEQG